MHLADSYYPYCSLQRQTVEDVTDFVLHQFQLLHDAYTHDRALIPPGALCLCVGVHQGGGGAQRLSSPQLTCRPPQDG